MPTITRTIMNLFRAKRAWLVILAMIVLVGAGLRLYKLDALSFNADEFLDINATYGYARTGQWQAWDFNFQKSAERVNRPSDERAWPYRWQVAQVLRHFPPTETAARSVSVLWGVLSIVAVYLVARSMTGSRTIGLVSAFLIAVSPMAIEYGRTLRMYSMFFPIFLLFSWALFRFLEPVRSVPASLAKRFGRSFDVRMLPLVVALGILSFLLHQLSSNIVFVLSGYLVFWATYRYVRDKEFRNKYVFLSVAGLVSVASAFALFPDAVFRSLGALVFFEDHYAYVGKVLGDFSHPILALLAIAGGGFFLWKNSRRRESVWLGMSLVIILLAAVFLWKRNVGTQYIYFAQSFAVILAASGIVYSARFVRDILAKKGRPVSALMMALSLLVLPNYGYLFADENAYRASSGSDSPDYRSAFAYFRENKMEGDVLITRDFRNYYFHDARVDAYDFGGELSKENFSISELRELMLRYRHGWIVYSDNDERYISKEARYYIEDNLQRERSPMIRRGIAVYRW